MGDEMLEAVISGLSLRGYNWYKEEWKNPEDNKTLILRRSSVEYKAYGSYPVDAVNEKSGHVVGRVGKEYSFHLKRLLQLQNTCTAVVQNGEPVDGCGKEILCDYVVKGKDTKQTRLVLLQFSGDLGSEKLKFYKTSIKVKIKNRWLTGEELQKALEPPKVKTEDENIPEELENDPETRKLYEKAIKEGFEVDRNIRVMLVGCFGQGKTTLAHLLLGEPIENVQSTDSIDICRIRTGENRRWQRQNSKCEDDINERLASIAASIAASSSSSQTSLSNDLSSQASGNTSVRQPLSPALVLSRNTLLQDGDGDHGDVSHDEWKTPGKRPREVTASNDSGIDEPHNGSRYYLRSDKGKKFKPEINKFRNELKNSNSITQKKKYISLWDFGGQYIYYATHQVFHSVNAVYLLVFKLNVPLDAPVEDEDFPGRNKTKTMKDYIMFWMNSIHSFVGTPDGKEPIVILIGTHRDMILSDDEAEGYMESVRDLFASSNIRCHIHENDFFVSGELTPKSVIEELRSVILERDGQRAVHVPAQWICLEKELEGEKEKNIITFDELKKIDDDSVFPITHDKQLKVFLKYHHARGTCLYFDEGEMSQYVVLNARFVIEAFRCIIRAKKFCQKASPELVPYWKKLTEEALLMPQLIDAVWDKEDNRQELKKWREVLLMFLKKHRIISEVTRYEDGNDKLEPSERYIVPSLLNRANNGIIEKFLEGKQCSSVAVVYSFNCIGVVETVFQRLTAAAVGTWPSLIFGKERLMFDDACVLELNLQHAGVLVLRDNKIELLVVNLSSESISAGTGDRFKRFVEVVLKQEFGRLKELDLKRCYTLYVRCFGKKHRNRGSVNMHLLDDVLCSNTGKGNIRCPDNYNCCVSKQQVETDWLGLAENGDEFPQRELTSKEYSLFSGALKDGWELLGLYLGLNHVTIEQIKMDHHQEAMWKYYMFRRLDDLKSPTFDVLVKAIRNLGDSVHVDWPKVYNIRDGYYDI